MFPLTIFSVRLAWFFFLFISFWPWEKDQDQVKKTSLEIPQDSQLLKVVRVALFYEKPQVLISAPASYEVKGLPGNRPLTGGPALADTAVRSEPSGIRMGATLYPVSGLRITSQTKEIQVGKKKYRNAIQVLKNPTGSLTVVNEVDVEDYLKGVLPWEANPEWSEEALKAQAVVSRTYAIFKNIENKDFPFTLSSDVGSQVYGGKTIEQPSTNRAVDETRGEILTYRGKIFPAFFHSTCGGRTTRADTQWKVESHPSLRGVECLFCQGSKYYSWKAEFSASEVQDLLAKKDHPVSDVRAILPKDVDLSGRPRFFVIKHAGGFLTLSANELRLILGSDRMRSTMVQIDKMGNEFLFRGRGWGHGVGMCQFGAKHLAELGYRYPDILRYYFPDSEIRNVGEFPHSVTRGAATPAQEEEGNIFKHWYQKAKSYVEDL